MTKPRTGPSRTAVRNLETLKRIRGILLVDHPAGMPIKTLAGMIGAKYECNEYTGRRYIMAAIQHGEDPDFRIFKHNGREHIRYISPAALVEEMEQVARAEVQTVLGSPPPRRQLTPDRG